VTKVNQPSKDRQAYDFIKHGH